MNIRKYQNQILNKVKSLHKNKNIFSWEENKQKRKTDIVRQQSKVSNKTKKKKKQNKKNTNYSFSKYIADYQKYWPVLRSGNFNTSNKNNNYFNNSNSYKALLNNTIENFQFNYMQNIYFEKQSKRLCGLHAINHLLQKPVYTQQSLNQICYILDSKKFFNQFKSFFGGQYDIDVLIYALKQQQLQIKWIDKRKSINLQIFQTLIGLLINKKQDDFFSHCLDIAGISTNHWLVLLKKQIQFVQLDSKKVPRIIKDVNSYLTNPYYQCIIAVFR